MLLENNPYPQDVRVRSEARSLADAGHEVTVVAPHKAGQPWRERIDGVRVIRFPLPDGSTRGVPGFVAEYLLAASMLHLGALYELARGATVLHLHNPPDVFFGAAAIYRLTGRKVVFDHHDLFPETLEVKFGGGTAVRIAQVCQRLTYAVANHAIVTNGSYAQVAAAHGKRESEVTVVRNAPPTAWTTIPVTGREGVLRSVRLAYLGAIASQDGVDGLAPVIAALCTGPDPLEPTLTVIGDGDARPAVERALAEHGVLDRVTFTGRVAPERVPELLAQADVCLDPAPPTDVNARSTMTKIAEYLALGKPVVAYDLLETRRTAGEAALLVPGHDVEQFVAAVRRLALDGELRGRLAETARRRAVAMLTWERSQDALLAAYRALRAA